MFKIGTALMVTCLLSAGFLVGIFTLTKSKIAEQQYLKIQSGLKIVLPESGGEFVEQKTDDFSYYIGKNKNGERVGYCFSTAGSGYGGEIKVLVGVDKDWTITGILVLDHKETPGLGAQIAEFKNKKEPMFTGQFKGKKAEHLVLVKDKSSEYIQVVTGATISSRAVVDSVKKKLKEFRTQMIAD
ncbi:MAG: RnfABCDGE type electron transport complex subunit G [Candidatus Omnitrophota bacterium]